MGSEVSVSGEAPLHIEMEVHGTDQLAMVEVARLVFERGVWERAFFEEFEDRDGYHEGTPESQLDYRNAFDEPFSSDAVYYLRVMQRTMIDGWPAFGWSSPIWALKHGR